MDLKALKSRKDALENRYEELTKIISDAQKTFDEAQTEKRRLEGAFSELENIEKSLTEEPPKTVASPAVKEGKDGR